MNSNMVVDTTQTFPTPDSPGGRVALRALRSGALQLRPSDPVVWASGARMPIYTDNRQLLRTSQGRDEVRAALMAALAVEVSGGDWDGVAGTASAGIAPAVLLAEELGCEFYYVRGEAKGHGLARRIEGLPAETSLEGRRILLVEDLFSTGGSSASAARALMEAGATVPLCLAIFSYGFSEVTRTFAALPAPCKPVHAVSLDDALAVAREFDLISPSDAALMARWQADPFGWYAATSGGDDERP